MLNISKAILDGSFDPDYFRWCFDRSAQSQAKNAANKAGDVATNEQTSANNISSTLTPFYRQELNAQHLYNPEQTNELLNFAEQGAGGANSGIVGQANSEAARTRNTSGFAPALDQAARDRQKAMSSASLGVGAQDVMGAKELNQEGAKGLSGLYDTDTNAMLKSMGIQNEDINSEIQAGKSGWFQNLMQGISTLTGGAKNAAGAYSDFQNA